jgi:hypothetical protein
MEAIKEILSAPSKWQLAPGETRYSSDQVIDAYLKGKSDGIQQTQKLIARQLDANVNKTVEQTNLLIDHLIAAGFHPVAAYIKIEDWDHFTIMVTVPDEEWCDARFLPVFDYVFDATERASSDFYNLEIIFCGLPDEGAFNEPYVFSDGFILKLNVR